MSSPPRRRKRSRVPDPPESLIRLIQTDPKVLAYMQSLQANLDEDVRIWKERAQYYQNSLKKQEAAQKKTAVPKSDRLSKTPTKRKSEAQQVKEAQSDLPIDESLFDDASSSDSESEGNQQTPNVVQPVAMDTPKITEDERELSFEQDILPLLDEAIDALMYIGIPLVDESPTEVSPLSQSAEISGETFLPPDSEDGAKTSVAYTRRTDVQVISDILYQVSAWTRLENAFDVQTLAANSVLKQAMLILFRALIILDTFGNCDRELLVDHPSKYTGIAEGRRDMVQALLTTLSAEISETWAIRDRSWRLVTLSQHYDAESNTHDTTGSAADEPCKGTASDTVSRARRFAPLVRSRLLAELTIGLHLSRSDHESAAQLVFNYVVATVPTRVEDYPKLPPVLSLVVLEGMLHPITTCLWRNETRDGVGSSDWFIKILCPADDGGGQDYADSRIFFCHTLSRCIRRAASIWKERVNAFDVRVHLLAKVEYACFERLLRAETWLVDDDSQELFERHDRKKHVSRHGIHQKGHLLSHLLIKDLIGIQESLRIAIMTNDISQLWPFAEAGRQIALRQMDCYQAYSNEAPDLTDLSQFMPLIEQTLHNATVKHAESVLRFATAVVKSCQILAEGTVALKTLEFLITSTEARNGSWHSSDLLDFFKGVKEASDTPFAYVINLKRRSDRLKAIKTQAMREKIIIALAVMPLDPLISKVNSDAVWGSFAFDGIGRNFEAQAATWARLGGAKAIIKALINHNWRPNDLKAFDRNATDDESLVKMSDTEIACALSHISSWYCAQRAMQLGLFSKTASPKVGMNNLFTYPLHMLRNLRISGFARGQALSSKHANMSPAPVVMILEDDAVLADRFGERLDELLSELPRDFHFCSIGYGRPKTAPIVPYGSQCGIPTHLFYLTGYLLSESGADYLLSSLPVCGPVDSFIGLKITSCWDNSYGETIGVGIQSKPLANPMAKADLASILQFRAFCALQPLCSQRVSKASATGRAWRLRDTDIQYSGERRPSRGSNRKAY